MSEHDSEHKFYIAGPMSGYEDHNAPAFYAAEESLVAIGVPSKQIFNPIRHEGSLMVQQGLVKDTQEAYRMCMAIDCDWICKQATAEYALAVYLGIDIFYQSLGVCRDEQNCSCMCIDVHLCTSCLFANVR